MVLDGVNDVGDLSPVNLSGLIIDVREVVGITTKRVRLGVVTESLLEFHGSHGGELVVTDGERALFGVDFFDLSVLELEQIKTEEIFFFGGV